MRYVDDWGLIVRMTERNYLLYLKAGAAGRNPHPTDFGKTIGEISFRAIDKEESDYQEQLTATEQGKS
jgi:hypothetical protein